MTNKVLSLFRKLIIFIPLSLILYKLNFFNNLNIYTILILLIFLVYPFFFEILENDNINLGRITSILLFHLPSILIGLLSLSFKGNTLWVNVDTSLFSAIFGFGLVVVTISFQFQKDKQQPLVTKDNRVYFSDFLLTMLLNFLFVSYFSMSIVLNDIGILFITILTALQIYVTLHYYIKVVMDSK